MGEKKFMDKKKSLEKQKSTIQNRIRALEEQEEKDEEEFFALKCVFDSINESLTELSKAHRKKLVWPATTMNGEPRTKQEIKRIVEKIERGDPMTKDEKKGIVGKSPFLDIEYFDIVRDIPTEYLHGTCLGVVKRLVSLTSNVGITRPRATKRKLTPPSVFNLLICKVKGTREFSRRVRNLDFSVLKGQEYCNIILFYFPIVILCIDEEYDEERKVWLFLAYMVRACVIPQQEFQNVNLNDIENCGKKIYTLYEKKFTPIIVRTILTLSVPIL